MNTMTIAWIALPFLIGFSAYLLPKLARFFALLMGLISSGYALTVFFRTVTNNIAIIG